MIIYILEKRNIFKQWLQPASTRTKEFSIGLLLAAIFCVLSKLAVSQLSGSGWMVSKSISVNKVVFSILYDLNSVLSEELLFRGVLLYLLIKYLTPQKGIVISAIVFGIYHWFSLGVFGNLMAMLVVFLVTGLMGFVFATAYEKTKSIMLPIGIHLGWNWISNTVFSGGPNGIRILEPTNVIRLEGVNFFFSLVLHIGIALLLLIFVRSKIIEERFLENSTAASR